MILKQFNDEGILKFSKHIQTLRENIDSTFSLADNENSSLSSDFEPTIEIDETKKFHNLFELGTYLVEILPKWTWDEAKDADKDSLWIWITALYFDQLHRPKGKRKCNGKIWYFVPEKSYTTYYRHKVRIAYLLTAADRMDKDFVEWLLVNQNPKEFGDHLENSVAYRQNLVSPSLQKFIVAHYCDEHGKIKKNTSAKWKNAKDPSKIKGNLRRFNVSLGRLGVVADVEKMKIKQIGDLWGQEYQDSDFDEM